MTLKFLKTNNPFTILFSIVAFIMAVVVIVMLVMKLTGHSPTSFEVLSWSVGIVLALEVVIISVLFPIKNSLGRLEEFKQNTKEFQNQTIMEINKIKENQTVFQHSLSKIKDRFK